MKISSRRIFDGQKMTGSGTIHIQNSIIKELDNGLFHSGAELVMPGFIDSHVHLLNVGLSLQALRLNDCSSKQDFVRALSEYARSYPGPWITGRGWDQNKLGFDPDRFFLDSVCPDRPVVLSRTCGHVVVANSRALELARINRTTPDVPGGVIKRDLSGYPTGILEEKAASLIYGGIPDPEPALLYGALEQAIKYAHSWGITGVQTDDRGLVGDYHRLWELYSRVTETHPIRAQLHYSINSPDTLQDFIRAKSELQDTKFIYTGAAKLFLDGSLGARTAALLEDYSDDPGNKGVLVYPDSVVREIMKIAEENGIQLGLHIIGDAAMEQALTVLSGVRGGYVKGAIPHRLIHCQVLNLSQLKRMAALGLVAEIQPVFLQTDMHWAGSRLGRERLQTSYCWRTMDRAGLFLTGGSDSPVEDINPWPGVSAAVTRTDKAGNYAGEWEQDEALDLDRALEIYSSAGAKLARWNTLGRIQAGMTADIAVYQRFDPNLAENKPDQVLIEGTIVYQR